jgi:hypothetical protein
MHRFLVLVAATVALDVFAPVVHAQDYVVNGHAASKAEAQFFASYNAQPGRWQIDGYGFARLPDEHPAQPASQVAAARCRYVLDVELCD